MIPRILHFVWAGGDAPLPPAGRENLAAWAAANPDFAVWLWVDGARGPAGAPAPGAELRDIVAEGLSGPEVRYELDGLWPNFGASSDRLRYEILWRFGGAYVDVLDVFPAGRLSEHGLLDAELVLRAEDGIEAMLARAGHPALRELADGARGAYDGRRWRSKLATYRLDGSRPPPAWGRAPVVERAELAARRALDTLHLTGPGLAHRLAAGVATVRSDWVRLPPATALSWARAPVVRRPLAAALDAAAATLRFEVDRMRLFNYAREVEHVLAAIDAPAAELAALRPRIEAELLARLAGDPRFTVDPRLALPGEPLRQLVPRAAASGV